MPFTKFANGFNPVPMVETSYSFVTVVRGFQAQSHKFDTFWFSTKTPQTCTFTVGINNTFIQNKPKTPKVLSFTPFFSFLTYFLGCNTLVPRSTILFNCPGLECSLLK